MQGGSFVLGDLGDLVTGFPNMLSEEVDPLFMVYVEACKLFDSYGGKDI